MIWYRELLFCSFKNTDRIGKNRIDAPKTGNRITAEGQKCLAEYTDRAAELCGVDRQDRPSVPRDMPPNRSYCLKTAAAANSSVRAVS